MAEIQLKPIISRPVNTPRQSEGDISPRGSSLQEFKVWLLQTHYTVTEHITAGRPILPISSCHNLPVFGWSLPALFLPPNTRKEFSCTTELTYSQLEHVSCHIVVDGGFYSILKFWGFFFIIIIYYLFLGVSKNWSEGSCCVRYDQGCQICKHPNGYSVLLLSPI